MGQNASKAASNAAKRVANAQKIPPAALHKHRPPPSQNNSSTNAPPPQQPPPEMPPDLIKFIQDVGPLKRKGEQEVKEKSQPRVQRTSMRLAEGVEGFETLRSTSFSTKTDDRQEEESLIDVVDIFRLIELKHQVGSSEKAVDKFLDENNKGGNKDNRQHEKEMLQMLECLEIPVILRDTDQSLVGSWPDRVEELKQLKLEPVAASTMKPVLQDLYERQVEEEKSLT